MRRASHSCWLFAFAHSTHCTVRTVTRAGVAPLCGVRLRLGGEGPPDAGTVCDNRGSENDLGDHNKDNSVYFNARVFYVARKISPDWDGAVRCISLPFFSCLPPGPALEDDVLFPSLFTFCFLSLILMRTDLGVEPSTRWKYQIRPSGDRTPRGRRRSSQFCTILRS